MVQIKLIFISRSCGSRYKDGSTWTTNAATRAFEDDTDNVHDEVWMYSAWKIGTNHEVVKLHRQVYLWFLDWVAISEVLAAYCIPLPVGTVFPGRFIWLEIEAKVPSRGREGSRERGGREREGGRERQREGGRG